MASGQDRALIQPATISATLGFGLKGAARHFSREVFVVGGAIYTPPTLTVNPAEGALTVGQALELTISDPDGLGTVIVVAWFVDLQVMEVIYFDGIIPELYSSTTKEITTTGFKLFVRRKGGHWPSDPEFKIVAFDQSGAQASE